MKEEKKVYQVCVITGTRAEYGLLRELLFKLEKSTLFLLNLVITGSHLSNGLGNTKNEIIEDGFTDFGEIPIPVDDDSKKGMAVSAGVATAKFAEYFAENRPDILVVLGDRYEILSAVYAAHILGIPVAHISGGDITEGAVDDAIRHSITKMSRLHFTGCSQSAKRVIQMGEQPQYVFDVGEPGVENCLKLELMSRAELSRNLQFGGIDNDYSVVTYHPVTMEQDTAVRQVYELIDAMDRFEDMSYIITMANADAGGAAINDIWLKEKEKHPNWLVVSSLGVLRYLSAVKYAKLVIGNSSSGIVEAPSLGTPTINIGDRQKGRMMAESVVCCELYCDEIINAMNMALDDEFQEKAKNVKSPFGDGTASGQIIEKLEEFLKDEKRSNKKQFFDIDYSV